MTHNPLERPKGEQLGSRYLASSLQIKKKITYTLGGAFEMKENLALISEGRGEEKGSTFGKKREERGILEEAASAGKERREERVTVSTTSHEGKVQFLSDLRSPEGRGGKGRGGSDIKKTTN